MRIIGNDPSTPRQAQVVASGTLSTGDAVVVNADGTVSVVVSSSGSQLLGSPSTYNGNETYEQIAVFDSNSNKVVVFYYDSEFYGLTAVVGTVSGTSISFGSEVSIATSGERQFSATFDTNANKVVVVYQDKGNSNYGTARVGTVSGTSISFGSAIVFESANSDGFAAVFDSNSSKVVVAYRNRSNGEQVARVGTVSGTSISFGGSTQWQPSGFANEVRATFDTNANKVIIVYPDSGNSIYGTAVVGNVSGTSISFGSPVVFASFEVTEVGISFNSSADKVVAVYRNNAGTRLGHAVVGTVSGTAISFGSPVIFEDSQSAKFWPVYDINSQKTVVSYVDQIDNGNIKFCAGEISGDSISFGTPVTLDSSTYGGFLCSVLDSSAGKIVTVYNDTNALNNGKVVVFQVAYSSTTLTANNYIGTAASGAADTQRVKINLKGAVDENQSGLTAGQSYYVQTDGTLGTTPDDPSVFAGTAVSATKLIVKG